MREIVRGRTCEVIAAQLAEEILSGRIPSGEELRQETVAGLLETSRIPVREALGILESLGLACRLSTRHVTAYCPEEKELTKQEYARLCRTAERRKNQRLCLILQTICGTGIRVSELRYITVEAAKQGEAVVN